MNILTLLQKMHADKTLSSEQLHLLLNIHSKKLFSLNQELKYFLYAGFILVIAGIGFTIKQYFAHLGDISVIGALTLGSLSAFIYCFIKGRPFSNSEVATPNMLFDYILFFGCTLYSMDIAYLETQLHVFGDLWDNHLLISAILFLFLAYRFDNRLVLSLALSTLAAWFGFNLSKYHISFEEYHRIYAVTYSLITFCLGSYLYRIAVKRHFFDIYLNFAIHFLFIGLISGVIQYKLLSLYFPALSVCFAILVLYALRTKKFLYMLYAIVYGYIGITIVILDFIERETALVFIYFIIKTRSIYFLN